MVNPQEEDFTLDDDDLLEPSSDENAGEHEHWRIEVDKGQSIMRVDKFLMMHMGDTSRNRIQKAAEAGCIRANGKPVKSNYKAKPGDVITLVLDRPKREWEIIPEEIPLDIIHEDDCLMVVNKPAGMVVHPGCGNYSGTMVNAIAWHMKDCPAFDIFIRSQFEPQRFQLRFSFAQRTVVGYVGHGQRGCLCGVDDEIYLSALFHVASFDRRLLQHAAGREVTVVGRVYPHRAQLCKPQLVLCICHQFARYIRHLHLYAMVREIVHPEPQASHDHQGGQNQCDEVPVDDGTDEFIECILKAHVTLFYICARAYVSLDICAYWAKVAN